MSEENNVFDNIRNSNNIENSSVYSKEIIDSLECLVKKLEETRNKIRGKKLEEMSQNDFITLKQEFDKEIDEYDKLKVDNDFTENELEELSKDKYRVIYLDKCLSIQTFISRIAHKINNHINNALLKKYEEKLKHFENTVEAFVEMEIELNNLKKSSTEANKTYEEIKKDLPEIKESILTITSLLLTIFSIIQINFIAFEKSSSYSILDRLILFSGINVFLLMAITTIFFIIKSIIEKKNRYYFFVAGSIGIFLVIFVFLSLCYDNLSKKINSKNINSVTQEEIININSRINKIDTSLQKSIDILKQDNREDTKNLRQDIQYLKQDIQYLKQDLKEITHKKNNRG